jgi:hypothetical protein
VVIILEEAASAGGLFHFKPRLKCRLLALFGPRVMSDLSPLCAQERTWADVAYGFVAMRLASKAG